MIRVRGPFSFAICLLALLETLHWSLGVDEVNCAEFLEREVINTRRASIFSSGDIVLRVASELADRETGRKHHTSCCQGVIQRKWNELERELTKRLREEKQLELSSKTLQVSELSGRNTGRTDVMLVPRGLVLKRGAEASPESANSPEAAYSNRHSSFVSAALFLLAMVVFGSTTSHGASVSSHNRGRAFATSSLLVLPLLFAPALCSTHLESNVAPLLADPSSFSSIAVPSSTEGGPTVYISAPLDVPADCDLQCWLNRLVIHIPDQQFTKFGVTGTVSHGVCTGIAIGDLQSSLVAPAGVSFTATGLSVQCTLDWGLTAAIFSASGSADAVVNNSRMAMTMQLQKDADGLASAANVTSCAADIQVTSIDFHGDLSTFLDLFRSEVTSIISSTLNSVVCDELGTLVRTNLTNVLQEIDTVIRPFLKPRPPVMPPVYPPGMVDLRNDPLLALLNYILDDVVGADGILGLNKIANALTNGTGAVAVSNISLSAPIPIASLGVITLGLKNVSVSGLNSWGAFDLLEPMGPNNLTSYTLLETLSISVAFSVNVSVDSTLGGTFLYEEGVLSAHLENNTLHSDLLLAVRKSVVDSLTDNQKTVPGCLLSALYDLNMTRLDFSFVLSQLQILATNGGTEAQLDELISNVFALLTSSFQPAIPALFNGVIAGPVRTLANGEFEMMLEVNQTCYDPASPETFNEESTIVAFSGAGAVFAVLLVVCVVALFITQIPSSSSPSPSDAEAQAPLVNKSRYSINMTDQPLGIKEEEEPVRSKWLSSLLLSTHFPATLRYGIVLLLLCNIALFISSNTSVGASVYAYVTLGDETTKLPSLFDFSLGNSVTDMWKAEVYALSLLIAVFSGAWPYIKLVMLLLCWVIPTKLLSRRKREWVLMALDILGKWSLIDAFVLTLMMVAFHFHIVPPVSEHTPPGTAAVDAFVEPHWGFYSFLLATMMSLATTHIILACHRYESKRIKRKPAASLYKASPPEKQKWESLCSYALKSNPRLVRFSWLVTIVITLLLLFSIGLLVAGSIINSFQFQFKGAFKMLLDFLHDDSSTSYSLISTGIALPESAVNPDSFGVRFVQVTWFSFAIAVPLCYLTMLLVLWLTPLTPRLQRAVFVLTEVFNAWSALEVVVVSIIAALLELEQFSLFIIGSRCDLINPLLEKYFGGVLGSDAKCFDVVATLDEGCWLLFGACIIYIVVGLIVQLTCHKALREREGGLKGEKDGLPININYENDYDSIYQYDDQED